MLTEKTIDQILEVRGGSIVYVEEADVRALKEKGLLD
jgi:hypothetical protein